MIKITLHALALLLFGLGAAAQAQAQALDLPPHQSLETRHICATQPIYKAPAGAPSRELAAGETVVLRDVTFGPDGAAWFSLDYATGKGRERALGYLPINQVRHFCPPGASHPNGAPIQSYLAPPNTCHLVAGYAESLQGLADLRASLPGFAPSASAYRLRAGGYALVLGLLSTGASERALRLSDQLPKGSACVSGADFSEVLVPAGAGFAPADHAGVPDAAALLAEARQASKADGMKQACDLGLGAACTEFAKTIYDAPDGEGRGPAVVTRYALLGCMAEDLEGCKLAINRQDNTLELAREQVLSGHAPARDQVTTELAKQLCDARDPVGCILQARGTAPDRSPTLVEAASNFAANLTACQQGIGWICESLQDGFAAVTSARDDGPTPDERFAVAGIEAGICTQGPLAPNQRSCAPAYYLYRDFLTYGDPKSRGATRIAQASAFLTSGCAAGDPEACATLSKLPAFWPVAERQAAAARAIALCDGQENKDSICESLGAALDPSVAEARPALRARYDAMAQSCRAPEGGSYQDCIQALHLYADLKAPDGLDTVEAMLKEACSPANLKGCGALAQIYGPDNLETQATSIPARNDTDAYLSALRMGCPTGRDAAEDGNTCARLADAVAGSGDPEAALQVRAQACEALISSGTTEDGWACYDAAKLALSQEQRLPEALRWAEFACDGADASVAPYGCKLAGNILSAGLGQPADPARALAAYQRGCFHHRVHTTDGEACLNYGRMLIDTVRRGEEPAEPLAFAHREDGEEPTPPLILSEASRAFDMGCMDKIAQACTANKQLLEDWSTGDLPFDPATCQVRTATGEITSEKPCRSFIFYQAAPDMQEAREQIGLNVYVWPDGDRSVTYLRDGIWRLNEVRTDNPVSDAQSRCWLNPISTRRFCVTMGGN
ncbi:sel1 repeat family protein [Paracoccus aminophilus]|uniref:Beta-lactamase n=1 Tax=Paracoccus aminophilus JCM 7686 TaxID=1367847 RepID=S5XYL3_PARAH|nr:sel1 repeat family protein [Paracoccus aminophilus]AGT08525.1 hypothetical protein JCM7686_1424 [Paracoccus aminophilus JCM 7686]